MLKWTVVKRSEDETNESNNNIGNKNGRKLSRRSLGSVGTNTNYHQKHSSKNSNKINRRKSLDSLEATKRRILNQGKENHIIQSTPHPITSRVTFHHSSDQPLRNLVNLTPISTIKSKKCCKRLTVTTPLTTLSATSTTTTASTNRLFPLSYATTLPTLDIEYSPCSLQSGQYLAMRGLNSVVNDAYYSNRCYFRHDETFPTDLSKIVDENDLENQPTNPKRLKFSPEITPLRRKLSEIRFSKTSLNHNKIKTNYFHHEDVDEDESLSSSALNDAELDEMIEAILESARKENVRKRKLIKQQQQILHSIDTGKITDNYTSTYRPATNDPANDLTQFCHNFQISPRKILAAGETTIILDEFDTINEREVKTPISTNKSNNFGAPDDTNDPIENENNCYLRRQKVVRRKHQKTETNRKSVNPINRKSVKRKSMHFSRISPETPTLNNISNFQKNIDEFYNLETPTVIETNTQNDSNILNNNIDNNSTIIHQFQLSSISLTSSTVSKNLYENNQTNSENSSIKSNQLQASSTPTGYKIHDWNLNEPMNYQYSYQQQLFSGHHQQQKSINKIRRCLTFTESEHQPINDSLEKRRSVATSTVSSRYSMNHRRKSISTQPMTVKGTIDLAIFTNENKLHIHVIRCKDLCRQNGDDINAYVKVSMLPNDINKDNNFQRTAVQRNSMRPFFDHRFIFDLDETNQYPKQRIQLSVWHRDREYKRSEFLGCMSFPINDVINKEINGSYKLQPQSCLSTPIEPITMCENTHSSVDDVTSIDGDNITGIGVGGGGTGGGGIGGFGDGNCATAIPLSRKAIHQRDADENLFLRFLELDPIVETPATINSSNNTNNSTNNINNVNIINTINTNKSIKQTIKLSSGRTPFTITKKLIRPKDKGYGFSIVWTHPPRIEKVEPGLSAEKAGILPGDFVVFVEKQNVVTMPEIDILNLIRSQGTTLTLEIFRRTANNRYTTTTTATATNGIKSRIPNITATSVNNINNNNCQIDDITPKQSSINIAPRPSTACSNTSYSVETSKRRLNLPQVTFSKESIVPQLIEDPARRYLYQLISKEQHFVSALQFGVQRFTSALLERRDIISMIDHKTLFQNIEEILQLSEDILEQLIQDEQEPQLNFASRVYLTKSIAFCAAYKKYCNGIKRADCVLVNKSRNANSAFVNFITEPQVPKKRPDMVTFIHRPLQHFREVLKLILMITSHCRPDSEAFKNFTKIINELQAAYRQITVDEGLMEPLGEGRPLLTLQDLESRLVFTKCKPFTLATHGRQWIFGGDLSRVEGRSVKPYWTLLFTDILLFAKVSRDRVLFITEEPLQLSNIIDSSFNVRKKATEFRLTIDPNGKIADSPTAHCAPDLSRTPKKNLRRRSIILRAPSPELKAVWQNLLQRQIFLINATFGSTLSSPLESPDIMQTFVPLSDIGATTTSMASIKLSSADSINIKSQQSKSSKVSRQIEEIIDEKCRILNKTGTSKGSALHLAQWMKGQLDNVTNLSERQLSSEHDDENLEEWSKEELSKRSKELRLISENGNYIRPTVEGYGRCESRIEEIHLGEIDEESKSASKSTTSDSQITVRSSPIANDKISVCRHCHKNCKQKFGHPVSNSLRVQHSQSSPNRCCQSIHSCSTNSQNSVTSTVTGDYCNHSNTSQLTSSGNDNSRIYLLNGNCSEIDSTSTITSATTSLSKTLSTNITTASSYSKHSKNIINKQNSIDQIDSSNKINNSKTTNNCRCNENFKSKINRNSSEIRKETCKIVNSVAELNLSRILQNNSQNHKNCKCNCGSDSNSDGSSKSNRKPKQTKPTVIEAKKINGNTSQDDDWSLMLVGLSQINPATALVQIDPFDAVPTISVVPATPDSKTNSKNIDCSQTNWDPSKLTLSNCKKTIQNTNSNKNGNINDVSPDDSPADEEPPYKALNAGLKRYGTMSSLERLPSDETDERTYNSSEEETEEREPEVEDEDDDDENDDIKIVTREVYGENSQSLRNWTVRAGEFMAEKMSFLEQSRAFLDSYLGRWDTSGINKETEDENIDECTSGEEVWGTPTSGENDEMQMFNSDNTHSSSTKSSSSLCDDDTELMMDELLMAPPMTASTIRGLLPRRRLEPLFEEDTESSESDEDNLPPDCSSSDQGQVGKICVENGHDIKLNRNSENTNGTLSNTEELPKIYGNDADIYCVPVASTSTATTTAVIWPLETHNKHKQIENVQESVHVFKNVDNALDHVQQILETVTPPPPITTTPQHPSPSITPPTPPQPAGLSPRLEMRLALNNNIMCDEDLINYEPGPPDLTNILGRDLSTYHRLTGRDLINRSVNRVCPKDAARISFSQQRNSKMDTPTPNRKKSNQNIWNNSVSVDLIGGNKKLSDLERLAKQEKNFCTSQLKSGLAETQFINHTRKQMSHEQLSITSLQNSKKNKFLNFLSRRNSENQILKIISKESLNDFNIEQQHQFADELSSPRKDPDKSLDRRFWKQLSKRRRSSSVSEIIAS